MVVGSLEPVLVERALHFPHLSAPIAGVVLELLEARDGMRTCLDADGLEGVQLVFVIDLQDESWQTAELPWTMQRSHDHGNGTLPFGIYSR